ncbi:unnamed protein product [Rotaria sordida]|uniref:Insulin-like domain-containing protein n=1 Tax=Rotaria sordida TaxID=392033 RepID=A0A818J5U1_9BILA|nr:unnamed protein product [Rotaria sordida]CAF0731465.1 unnamed protein product [Rotaria sordida]CAF0762685.1 unnamed protein product [Rotaria sordida]CAF0784365.1 unnamed protein product [Rotaria sordida]CAF0789232.1 unnamed protein product [Rotaria sordida]
MNNYIPLWLIALVATIQTLPTIDNYNDNNNKNDSSIDHDNKGFLINTNLQDDHHYKANVARNVRRIIDGKLHYIKAADVTYRQRLRNDQCVVEYNDQYLTENSLVQIRKKLYRVEDCLLERVFHACGPNLLLMLNVVCRIVEQHQTTTTPPPLPSVQQRTMSAPALFFRRIYPTINRIPREIKASRMITESCCESLCTLSELTRYCHR